MTYSDFLFFQTFILFHTESQLRLQHLQEHNLHYRHVLTSLSALVPMSLPHRSRDAWNWAVWKYRFYGHDPFFQFTDVRLSKRVLVVPPWTTRHIAKYDTISEHLHCANAPWYPCVDRFTALPHFNF